MTSQSATKMAQQSSTAVSRRERGMRILKRKAPVTKASKAAAAKLKADTAQLIQEYIYPTQQGLAREGLEATTAALFQHLWREIKRHRPEKLSPEYMVESIKAGVLYMCPVNHEILDAFAPPPPAYPGGEYKRPIKACCFEHFEGFGRYVVEQNKDIDSKAMWTKAHNAFKRNDDISDMTGADHAHFSMYSRPGAGFII